MASTVKLQRLISHVLEDAAKQFRLGLKDEGTLTINVIWLPDDVGQARCQTLLDTIPSPTEQFRITLNTPDSGGDTLAFDALVQSFTKSAGVDTVWTGVITLRLTGAVVYTDN